MTIIETKKQIKDLKSFQKLYQIRKMQKAALTNLKNNITA